MPPLTTPGEKVSKSTLPAAAPGATDFAREHALLAESAAALAASDYVVARAKAVQAIQALLEQPGAERDDAWLKLLDKAGRAAFDAQDADASNRAWRVVLEVRSNVLSDKDLELQRVRRDLAFTLRQLGDLAGARALEEKAVEVLTRTVPDEHPDLLSTRLNLAITMKELGDLAGARALEEQVLAVAERTLPEDHSYLQNARGNLAGTIKQLGDLSGARKLEEQVLEVRERKLAEEHPDLQRARLNLATTLRALGELARARRLQEQVLRVRSRTLPEEHPDLLITQANLANTLVELGELAAARELQAKVLEVRERTVPNDHPELQRARLNLAATIKAEGDLTGSKALLTKVLEVRSRTLPDDHPDLQRARANLATTIKALGDVAGARALEEKVLEVRSRTLPEAHPDVQRARQNLAVTLKRLGDLPAARALEEAALAVLSRSLSDEHLLLQGARSNLAVTLHRLGDLDAARALLEQVLEVRARVLPEEHPQLQAARTNLALTAEALGDHTRARALFEQVLEVRSRTLPEAHHELQGARHNLAVAIARASARHGAGAGDPERCVQLLAQFCAAQTRAARSTLLESAPREAESRCGSLAQGLDFALSVAGGLGFLAPSSELERLCFELSETTRGAALSAAAMMRVAASVPRYAELRGELAARSRQLARITAAGTTSDEFREALEQREGIERELVALGGRLSGEAARGSAFSVDALASALGEHDALVAYRRYRRSSLSVEAGPDRSSGEPAEWSVEECLHAVVLRSSGGANTARLHRVELGSIARIEAAVRAWRDAAGAGLDRGKSAGPGRASEIRARGDELRALVLDPLSAPLAGARRLIVVLDDVLHLVPLDALPMEVSAAGREQLAGDRWRIDTRRTATEILSSAPRVESGVLVALGGASFNSPPLGLSEEELAGFAEATPDPASIASMLRGGPWEPGFSPLTFSGAEAREVVALHEEVAGEDAGSMVLEKRKASRAALETLAPRARFLHVATHGWFASESIRSWSDPEPLDRHSGLAMRLSGEEQVRGMSPMLLCGLALAGANLPEDAVGRAPGMVTAEEIAALDLTRCELAVLSACDTNVGERRAGQGVASLQLALQMAGARSVITSLWKVPDEATKELMLDFYRRLWVERKPKWRALWEAKTRLRDARDERGDPRYSLRDWAAWVLTGEPD